jgi:hypothetical protein
VDGAPPELLDSYEAERRPAALAAMRESGQVHEANVLAGEAGDARDRALATTLATPAQVLGAVEHGHELDVAYRHSPIVGAAPAALGVRPGDRVPDAGPLVRADGSTTSFRELLRATEMQLWVCAGTGSLEPAVDLARRFAPRLRARVLVVADRPPDGDVEVLADPALRAHGRLGAVADGAFVVRPDGYLGFRCEPPDAAPIEAHLAAFGL